MPRGKQTTRRTSKNSNDTVVDNPELGEEEAQKLKKIEEGEMHAQIKHIDKNYTEQGQIYYAETAEEVIPDQINWSSKFALCVVRHMDDSNESVLNTSLQVNSQHLKDVLKNTISSFPGVSFQTKEITIDEPYRVLFHYKDELEQAREKLVDGESAAHLDLLLDFIYEKFKDTIKETENLREQGLMSYRHLWTLFRPGTTIYAQIFGQPRAFKLDSYLDSNGNPPGLQLSMKFVDFDGDDFGTRQSEIIISPFAGAERICDLEAFPIEFHPEPEQLRRRLIQRGKRFEQFAGMHFNCYNGIALEYTGCGVARYNIDGRVVIDCKTHHRLNADRSFGVDAFVSDDDKSKKRRRIQDEDEGDNETAELVPQEKLDLAPLSDELLLLTNAMVRGFSFTEKHWLEFFVDKLTSPNWNTECFDQLVLPKTQKDLVQALVANHVQQRSDFDDIVKGKGQGLVLVLHGPAGVGKTLTAETVAEFCKRPLYMVSSGDLGTTSEKLDERLSRILDMASTWKAVLLIDEADVFLERRSLHDMERNGLVSIFLRVLEYYKGILFLTSNRVSAFDDAFKSRIHVPLKYNVLTVSSRTQIWKHFLRDENVNDEDYQALAQADINGRQIKNVIRTAKSLAQFRGQKLDRKKLEQVIELQVEFEAELDLDGKAAINGVDGSNEVIGAVSGAVNGH